MLFLLLGRVSQYFGYVILINRVFVRAEPIRGGGRKGLDGLFSLKYLFLKHLLKRFNFLNFLRTDLPFKLLLEALLDTLFHIV